MAPLRKVSKLYSLCTNKLFSILSTIFRIYDNKFDSDFNDTDFIFGNKKKKDLERVASANRLESSLIELRHYLIENLNHKIRQDLIDFASKINSLDEWDNDTCYINTGILLDFLLVLVDSRIARIDTTGGNESFTFDSIQCRRLINILNECKVTALQELIIQVHFQSSHAKHQITPAVTGAFYSYARVGLGSSLSKLVLHSICDNMTLELLGKCAVNLTCLDISRSWSVTDHGILKLLSMECSWFLRQTSNVSCNDAVLKNIWNQTTNADVKLNPCSSTLKEVRIQDTDTTVVAVGLLLRFVKNLQSLGGFIYYRNVGDVVWLFTKQSQGKERLNLSCLHDSQMPEAKAIALANALPNLSSLYTRALWLPYLAAFPKLTNLTADFDRRDCNDQLRNFFLSKPCMLRQLIICDEAIPLQLSLLAENCIHLEELECTLTGAWKASERRPFFPKLLSCRIFTKNRDTVYAFLAYNNSLREFQVCIDNADASASNSINDDTIWDAMKSRTVPSKLETVVFSTDQLACCISEVSVWTFADLCPELRRLGDLKKWQVWQKWNLAQAISKKNLDLDILISGKPYFWSRHDI